MYLIKKQKQKQPFKLFGPLAVCSTNNAYCTKRFYCLQNDFRFIDNI